MAGTERERGRVTFHVDVDVHFPLFISFYRLFFFLLCGIYKFNKVFQNAPLFRGTINLLIFVR